VEECNRHRQWPGFVECHVSDLDPPSAIALPNTTSFRTQQFKVYL